MPVISRFFFLQENLRESHQIVFVRQKSIPADLFLIGKKQMSGDRVFLDTNIIAYLYSDTDLAKKHIAFTSVMPHECVISTQVLNEFSNIGTKKLKLSIPEIRNIIEELLDDCYFTIVTNQTIQYALFIKERYGFSYYDCLMVASAIECECDYLFSEDLQDGQVIEGVVICNIFGKSTKI
jgi:predicted nucleic acid-binding protein